jgi:hypothetical protein
LTPICCTSTFDPRNKYIAVVTIVMAIEFGHGSVTVDYLYYRDFQKIASFFAGCSKITVLFEDHEMDSEVFIENPLAQLRFKNIATFLFNNFDICPALFFPMGSDNFTSSGMHTDDLDSRDHYQIKFLFRYQNLPISHYAFG